MFRINRIEYKIVEPGSAEQKPSLGSNSGASQHSPLVTCVMVTRGVVPILRHSAECFRRQTYPHRELLVICNQNEENVESFFTVMTIKT